MNSIPDEQHLAGTDADDGALSEGAPRRSRRGLILAGAVGAAAGALATLAPPTASASSGGGDQQPMILGSNNSFKNSAPQNVNAANVSSVATVLEASPNYSNYTGSAGNFVLRVDARPAGTTPTISAIEGYGTGSSGAGVYGYNPSGYGMVASGTVGISATGTTNAGVYASSTSWNGVTGLSQSRYGGEFTGGQAAIRLGNTGSSGAPVTGAHVRGELIVDSGGVLWLCKTSGSPGTWVKVSEQATGGAAAPSFQTLPTPERFIDTRSKLGDVQGPVPAGTTSTFQMTGRNGESGNAALQIPAGATAIVGNLSVIASAGAPLGSFVTMWPTGDRPTTSSISFGPGSIIANAYTVGLAAGKINVFAQQACDYIVDVVGYYG